MERPKPIRSTRLPLDLPEDWKSPGRGNYLPVVVGRIAVEEFGPEHKLTQDERATIQGGVLSESMPD